MLKIKQFEFNHICVNTYILSDETCKALVIDPAFSTQSECDEFDEYIFEECLDIVEVVFTHPHADHLVGGACIYDKYRIVPKINSHSKDLVAVVSMQAAAIGFGDFKLCPLNYNLEEGENVCVGNMSFDVMYMPGHADGSVCLYSTSEKVLFTGDVLFRSSIGRTDFPTGDYDTLINNIKNRIFVLPDDVKIYPGHGCRTSVKFERNFNPFFKAN
jgi:hydroxyacylglutathione hydrolase